MLFGRKSVVGLDIGSNSIKAVELEKSGSRYRLVHFGHAPLPPEAIVQGSFMNAAAIADAIRQACETGGMASRNVATSVSGHAVIVKRISLPAQTNEELDESIRWEAEQYVPFDINEVNIDHQVLQGPSVDGQMDVLLVAAKKDLIDDYINVVADSGLHLAVMDIDAFAVGNMYEHNYEPADDSTVALVDIGAAVINISVLEGAIPVFTRDVTSGGNQYTEEIQKNLNVSFDEAERIKIGGAPGEASTEVVPQEVEEAMRDVSENLVGEVQRSLEFFRATSSKAGIDKLVLCGGAARVPGLDRVFEERVEVPVTIVDPFARIELSADLAADERLRHLGSAMSVAVGLGMRRVEES